METVKVSSKGQIVIPKALREAGHIQAGTEVIISAIADGLMLTPAQRSNQPRSRTAWACWPSRTAKSFRMPR